MPAKRRYDVKSNKDFLVLAVIFFFLGIWAVKDAWFPSDKVLQRHPRLVEASFEVDGFIGELHVGEGDTVIPPRDGQLPTLLASLNSETLEREFETKQAEYNSLKSEAPEQAQTLYEEITRLKAELDRYQLHCPKLGKEKSGTVLNVLKGHYSKVEAGEPVMLIEPSNNFYLFNKTLTFISFILCGGFLTIHILGR